MLYTIIIILIIIAAILLGIVVLAQNAKGGGVTSTFSASNQIMGVRKTTDFMEKATWTLAIIIVVLSFASSIISGSINRKSATQEVGSKATQAVSEVPVAPVIPAAAPVTTAEPVEGEPLSSVEE